MAVSLKKRDQENPPILSEYDGDIHTQNDIINDLQEAENQKQKQVAHAERRRKAKKYGILATGVLTLAALVVFLLLPGFFYMQGKSALENKQYQDAISYYTQADGVSLAGGFFDAYYMATTGVYLQQANDGESSGDYDTAMSAYRALGDSTNVTRMQYLKANSLFIAGEYIEATNWYASLPEDYEDVKDRLLESRYMSAKQHWQEGRYEDAIFILNRIDVQKYADSKSVILDVKYDYMLECIEQENYAKAYDLIGDLRRTDKYKEMCAGLFPQICYSYAQQAEASGDYGTAMTMYRNAGDHQDANEKEIICSYQYACEQYEAGNYEEAAEHFDLNGYEDSTQRMHQAMYDYVLTHKNNENEVTYDYLQTLIAAKYEDAVAINKELYKWSVKVVINTSESDTSTNKSYISRYSKVYCHLIPSGGSPYDSIKLKYVYNWPGSGSDSGTSYILYNGSEYWYSTWYTNPQYGNTGTFTAKIYNANTNELLATKTVEITR
jgi:tetratricopeptide (TPR) repeat protein